MKFHFHNWSPWEQYHVIVSVTLLRPPELAGKQIKESEWQQSRKCLKCGKMQKEKIIIKGKE